MYVPLSRRARVLFVNAILTISILFTANLVRRQSLLLPDTSAAPRPTVSHHGELGGVATVGPRATPGRQVRAPVLGRAAVIDDQRFFYVPDFYAAQIQQFLDKLPGPLKNLHAPIGDREHSFAEILSSRTILDCVNPQVVLALLEQQSHLLTTPDPTPDRLDWAMGFHGEDEHWKGVLPQVRWAIRELRTAQRDYPGSPELTYADKSHSPMPAGLNLGGYAIARVLAATSSPSDLAAKLRDGPDSFVATYTRLFGDPRTPSPDPPAVAPFLAFPLDHAYPISSFFDHESPFLLENGSIVPPWGQRSTSISYDGHTGWDYAAAPPAPVFAAAPGTVVFAGNADDNCATQAVIIDHGNGYRTLYWHLSEVLAQVGPVKQGDRIGTVGASGCVTGPHLHFQVQFLGHDVDPYGWCGPSGKDPWALHPSGAASVWLWASSPSPCALPSSALVVDAGDAAWRKSGAGWEELAGGVGGTALVATSVAGDTRDLP